LERAFKEVRRRANVIGRFSTETAALAIVFGILEEERLKWRQVKMRAERTLLGSLRRSRLSI